MAEYWYVPNEHGPVGPVSLEFMRQFLSHREAWREVPVWKEGFEAWRKAGDVEELRLTKIPPPFVFPERNGPPPYKADAGCGDLPTETSQLVQAHTAPADLTFLATRLLAQIVSGVLAAILIFVGVGARKVPHTIDHAFGLASQLIGVLIVYVVFFRWDYTAIRRAVGARPKKGLAITYLVLGSIELVFSILMLLSYMGGGGAWLTLATVFDPTTLLITMILTGVGAAGLLVVGYGLFKNLSWAPQVAIPLTFLISFARWPLGFILSLYTWWEVASVSSSTERTQIRVRA